MDESFEIPVTYKGKELSFPAVIHHYGYSFKIEVLIHDVPVYFERDDQRQWRALSGEGATEKGNSISSDLIGAVVEVLESVTD